MKISKGHLQLLLTVLGQTVPNFVEARLRDRVIKSLSEDFTTYDEDRVKICKALCDKDEKGEPKLENGSFQFKENPENLKQFNEELAVLQNEEVKLQLEGNEKQKLTKLIESTKYSPKMGEVELIDTILGINDSIPTPEEFMPKND